MKGFLFSVLSATACLFMAAPLHAQYFGRNKPVYKQLDFKVSETEHFRIYEHTGSAERRQELAAAAEQWYDLHRQVLQDSFTKKNPLLIYNDHAGFQQTNTIPGEISVGTGGVTEGLRNRIVFPIAMTNQQTHHVMGHELVHAFQYKMVLSNDSSSVNSLANLPLWMIEGLAEYLSVGRIDPHTALWMRDAVQNDRLPRIKDLDSYKYFPYRWGQAFWAFVTGVYGDEVVRPLFMNTARYGIVNAVPMTLGTSVDSLSSAWQYTLRNHYGRWVTRGKAENPPGKVLLSDDNAGKMNISPVLSPNGKYLIFLSEKNIFTTDLFLADAKTGKILKKVASNSTDGHIDQFNYLESAGTWAPDDKRFAFDVYENGRSVLVIKDVFKGKTKEKISLSKVPAFSNPAWSPDGKSIVVSGSVNGQTDLYLITLKNKKVRQLTNDRFSEIHASWSPDGRYLVYSTDQLSMERGRTNGVWTMNLAILDVDAGSAEQLDLFPGADNMNPHFDKNGQILFLSNRDGFRNLYRYDPGAQKIFQMTRLNTGITGITPYAPAITVAEDRDKVLYTYFNNGEYVIYKASGADFLSEEVSSTAVDMVPATLPPFDPRRKDIVNVNLRLLDSKTALYQQQVTPRLVPYRPGFKLEYMGGGGGMGLATGNSSFGQAAGLAGGIDMLFGDILGNNQLYAGVALNGSLADIGGQFSYLNRKHRINWGASVSHIPFRSGAYRSDPGPPGIRQTLGGQEYVGYQDYLYEERYFQERAAVFAFYPLSVTRRFELGAAFEYYHQTRRLTYLYYDPFFVLRGQDRVRLDAPGGTGFPNLNAAYVGDNSHFGMTSPLLGHRYRIGVEQYFGNFSFSTLLLDGRKYFRLRPFTLAVRGIAYGRMGRDAEEFTQFSPLFAGNPWFVRGFQGDALYVADPTLFAQTIGSKILIGNAEIRLPFTGPKPLALLSTRALLTDLNLFFDAGLAFDDIDDLKKKEGDPTHLQHKPIFSAGFSFRINLFGAVVLEPYFAVPLSVARENQTLRFGLNFVPGF
jgi:hypothetical protein